MMISLETHNEKNVAFYAHFGFKVFGIVEKGMVSVDEVKKLAGGDGSGRVQR